MNLSGNLMKYFVITFAQNGDHDYADKHDNDLLSFQLPHDIVQELMFYQLRSETILSTGTAVTFYFMVPQAKKSEDITWSTLYERKRERF